MTTPEIFNIIESCAVIAASVMAYRGLDSWRKETKFKREYELAEETLSALYDAKERIDIIRSPIGMVSEGSSRKPNPNETEEEKQIQNRIFIARERYNNNIEPFTKLQSLRHRFVVVFGKEFDNDFKSIFNIISQIFYASYVIYGQRKNFHTLNPAQIDVEVERMKKYEAILWCDFDKEDETKKEINRIINSIESVCIKIIRKK